MRGCLWKAFGVLLWMAASGVAASRYAVVPGVLAAIFGAALGVLAGGWVSRTRIRDVALVAGSLGIAFLALVARGLAIGLPLVSGGVGAGLAYALGDILLWGALPFAVTAAFEALARRRPAFRSVELASILVIYAALFASHREGFTNRPYAFVDPIWSRGKDPLGYFLLLGAALAALLIVTLAKGWTGRRSAAGVLVLLGFLAILFFALPQGQLKNVAELHRVMGKESPDGDRSEKSPNGDRGNNPPGQGERGTKGEPSGSRGSDKGEKGGCGQPGSENSGGSKERSGVPDTFADLGSGKGDQPVAVVVFRADFKPPLGYYYFREGAFSSYNGVRLIRDPSGRFDKDVADGYAEATMAMPSAGLPLTATRLPGVKGDAFTRVPTTVALLAPHPKPFGLINPSEFSPAENPDPRRFFRAYGVVSSAFAADPRVLIPEPAGGRGWGDAEWRHYTRGPEDPRFAALAEEAISALPAGLKGRPFARALAIKLWLDKHGTYSLNSGHSEEGDPLSGFLFGDLTGHCVHFAHAACLLYRAAGVPARVAVGYAVRADFKGTGQSLLIRGKEAHAWPEVCLRKTGWIPLDISPEKVLSPPEDAPDQGLQKQLGEMAAKVKPPPEVPPQRPREDRWALAKVLLKGLMISLLALAILALPACYTVKLWRRSAPFWGFRGRVPVTAYRASLDLLSEAGLRRRRGESREAFALRAGLVSGTFPILTKRHLRHTLGRPGVAVDSAGILQLFLAVKLELKAGASGSARLARALHPTPWWGIR